MLQWAVRARVALAVLCMASILSGGPPAGAANAWDLVHPRDFDWRSHEQRLELAADLRTRLNLLIAVVPPQAPQALERVQHEQAELEALAERASPRRLSRLYLSRDYQHMMLVDLLTGARAALDCVLAATAVEPEMACWAQLSGRLLQEQPLDVALRTLREAHVLPRDEDMPVKAQDPLVWYGEYGRGVLEQILTPYLESVAAVPQEER
ncbi:MAG: hypothetical protein R3E86_22290 [Pseudomonadales bacterium]